MTTHNNQQPGFSDQIDAMARLAKLWTNAMPALEAFVRAMVRDPHDVDDVIQETGEYVARMFYKFEEGTSFTGWVITIARLRIARLYQNHKRDRLVLNSEVLDSIAKEAEAISQQISERQAAMQVCVESLQPKHQQLLEMCYMNGQKPAQIAEQMGRTPNAISASLMRVRKALKRCIEDRLLQTTRCGV